MPLARAAIFPRRASAIRRGLPRSTGSSATPPPHRLPAARDRLRARRWSAPCAGRNGSTCWRGRTRRCSRRRCSPAPASRFHSGIALEPAEAIGGLSARVIFAADETAIAEPVEFTEQEWIIQFLAVRFVARGNARDLDMADDRHHLAQPHGHVAMDDLAVIDVELKFQIGDLQFADQVARETKIVEEVSGHAARVDRLDHDVEAVGLKELGGPYHRLVKRRYSLRIAALCDARPQMQSV